MSIPVNIPESNTHPDAEELLGRLSLKIEYEHDTCNYYYYTTN